MTLYFRNFRFLLLLILLFFITGATLFATGAQERSVPEAEENMPILRIGSLPAESAIPIILAFEKGYFAAEGVAVQIIPFSSPNDRNVAFQAGELDGLIGDIMTAVSYYNAGFPVVMTSDINEDFKLLTAPESGITSFRELDGKEVSLVPGFVLEYIMDEMAAHEGIRYSTLVIPSIPARFEALLNNQVSAVLFTEPQASLLAAQGAGVLAGSKSFGIKAGAMIFSRDVVTEKKEALRAYYRACDRMVSEINGTELSEYVDVLSNFSFPPTIRGIINYLPAEPINIETYNSVLDWMRSKGTLKADIPFEEITFQF